MSTPEACARSSSLKNANSPQIHLTIAYWLWWLSITAVLLATHRDMMHVDSGDPDPRRAARTKQIVQMNRTANLAVTPFHALAICGLGLAAWRRARFGSEST